MSKLIDCHFHLDFYRNHKEIYDQINSLNQYTLCVTNSPEVYLSCKKLYRETRYLKFAVGFNPKIISNQSFDSKVFKYALKSSNYIGEVGLDFSKQFYAVKEKQINAFSQIINLASEEKKIISIHSYMAEESVLDTLIKYKAQNTIMHWYTGSEQLIKEFIKIGCYFSINCNMIKSTKGCRMLKLIPQDRILIESDGPFSKVNDEKFNPLLLSEAYKLIGNCLGLSNIRDIVFDNFQVLLSSCHKIE